MTTSVHSLINQSISQGVGHLPNSAQPGLRGERRDPGQVRNSGRLRSQAEDRSADPLRRPYGHCRQTACDGK